MNIGCMAAKMIRDVDAVSHAGGECFGELNQRFRVLCLPRSAAQSMDVGVELKANEVAFWSQAFAQSFKFEVRRIEPESDMPHA